MIVSTIINENGQESGGSLIVMDAKELRLLQEVFRIYCDEHKAVKRAKKLLDEMEAKFQCW